MPAVTLPPFGGAALGERSVSPVETARPRPRIWAIASGKGGVGKSIVSSNLAVSFARRGRRCTLVDLDLGCPNLHTLLGAPPARTTICDFLNRKIETLEQATAPTPVPNLSLISGDRASATAANPVYAHKQKLLRHIAQLDADDVFLDLGAGAGFNVLDFFLAADCGIIVVVPEPTSIENAYHFLKAAFFRSLREVARTEPVQTALQLALEQRKTLQLRPLDLLEAVSEIDREAGDALHACAERFAAALLVNQVRDSRQRTLGPRIARECREHLGVELCYLGAVARDERITEAVRNKQPALSLFPGSTFAHDFGKIAQQLFIRSGSPRRVRQQRSRAGSTPERLRKPAACQLPPLDLDRPGSYLQRCRERLGIELEELSRRTRIRCLRSIELEAFDRLPPERYAREFVAQYASALGIREAQSLAASFASLQRLATQSG